MWLPIVAIVVSFLLGVTTTALILYRFSKLPGAPNPPVHGEMPESETTQEVAPVELDQLAREEKASKGLAAFEEKTRQVNVMEFADLLNLDHEEIVAEPLPVDNEEQLSLAREDSRRLQTVIEKSGPLGQDHPRVMIQVIPPSRYVFSTRNPSCGLPN